jgi:hypothetical protein
MECSDDLRPGFQIWQYQIEWQERVERMGYLFFGAPNDRPTAQPERDFYVYFIQPFEPPKFRDDNQVRTRCSSGSKPDDDIKRHLAFYAAAQDLASTASGGAKAVYLDKAKDAARHEQVAAGKADDRVRGHLPGQDQDPAGLGHGRVNMRDRRAGPDERINFRDVVNVVSGLALNQRFAEVSPEYPTFPVLVTESNRKQLVGNALKALAGGTRTKDANAILDALEMLDGDRIEPGRSRYSQEVLNRLKAKGHGQVLNRSELLNGQTDVEYFHPVKFRWSRTCWSPCWAAWSTPATSCWPSPATRSTPARSRCWPSAAWKSSSSSSTSRRRRRSTSPFCGRCSNCLACHPAWRNWPQGSEEPVKQLLEAVSKLVGRVLTAGTDLQGKLTFWGKPLLTDDEIRDWRTRLEALKTFTEA